MFIIVTGWRSCRRGSWKSKVETAVRIIERQILARLRNHSFFSLDELNRELRRLLAELNVKPFQKLPGSRRACSSPLNCRHLPLCPPVSFFT
jgi:hypothetical protein